MSPKKSERGDGVRPQRPHENIPVHNTWWLRTTLVCRRQHSSIRTDCLVCILLVRPQYLPGTYIYINTVIQSVLPYVARVVGIAKDRLLFFLAKVPSSQTINCRHSPFLFARQQLPNSPDLLHPAQEGKGVWYQVSQVCPMPWATVEIS